MTDDQLEEQLRRFTVPGPASSLRTRVLADSRPPVRRSRGLSDVAIGCCLAGAFAATVVVAAGLSLRAEQERIEAVMEDPELARQVNEAVALLGSGARGEQMFAAARQQQLDREREWKALTEQGAWPW